ncbi:hypothetical protein ACVIIV_003383 [Bradyrhizobium sp. USDA 4354]
MYLAAVMDLFTPGGRRAANFNGLCLPSLICRLTIRYTAERVTRITTFGPRLRDIAQDEPRTLHNSCLRRAISCLHAIRIANKQHHNDDLKIRLAT